MFIVSVVQKHLHILGIIVHKYPEYLKLEETNLLLRIYLAQLVEQVNSYILSYMFVLCEGELTSSEKIHMKYCRAHLNCVTKPSYVWAPGSRVSWLCYVILIVLQIVCQAHLCDGLHVGHVIAWEKCVSLSRACSHLQYFPKYMS